MLKIGACDISEAGITIRIKVIVNQTKAGKKEINLVFTFFLRKTKKKGLPKRRPYIHPKNPLFK